MFNLLKYEKKIFLENHIFYFFKIKLLFKKARKVKLFLSKFMSFELFLTY